MFRFSNLVTQTRFLQTYGALNSVDLWVGGLAEERIPGGVIGPTFACLFAITFNDLCEGDRFWYENDNVFTPSQLTEIKRTSLARILCDNGDDISSVQKNAFFLSREQLSCSAIPRIDLSAWKDDLLCFQRVRIEPTTQEVLIYFKSDLLLPDTQRRSYPLLQEGGRQIPYETCVPFVCPTERPTLISNFPADNGNFFRCQVTANSNLPQSLTYVQSAYEAMLTRQNIQASSGLFTDVNSCQQSSATVAFSFRCPNYYYNTDSTQPDGQEILQCSNTLLPRFNITEAVEYEPLRIAPVIVDFIKSAPNNLVSIMVIDFVLKFIHCSYFHYSGSPE
jgi:peroxidase